ncbi:sigma-54-dependent Fis family transcriptional regulator [Candidatus Sumerlaeota bacterium]|nr:sigma-54-dependent Fis family transcriptional regulator [Candidatus Sumerlaeota bacterium]
MKALIADDEENIRFVLKSLVQDLGFQIVEAADGAQALDALRSQHFDLAVLDIKMPEADGITVLHEAREIDPTLVVVIVTAFGTDEQAMEAIREGAYDYFVKPFEIEDVRITIRRAMEKKRLTDRIRDLEAQVSRQRTFHEIVGSSQVMQDVFEMMQRVVDNDVPVLIAGESGTGKELVARAIHARGPRRDNPMVRLNCAAIPESLLESELFGHERGSFTGAVSARPGKFELASGGTLFLDEIGDMPLALQAKILRAVQEREIQRVGGRFPISIDARLITASNRDLAEEVAAKRFREDLYFRINVIAIELPPLRKRVSDIPLLLDFFIDQHSRRLGKPIRGLSREALDLFLQYEWPGNVRELENALQRAIVMARGPRIEIADLPSVMIGGEPARDEASSARTLDLDPSLPMPEQVERVVEVAERRLIAEVLEQTTGRQEAADRLGISRKSLHNKMLKYGMMGKE